MSFISIVLKVIASLAIIGAIVNIFKKKDVAKNKRTLKGGLLILVIAIGLGGMETSDPKSTPTNIAPVNQAEKQENSKQKDAYQAWISAIKSPLEKHERSIKKFTNTLKGLQSGTISNSDGISIMNDLESKFSNEINFEFRNLTPPDKSLFNEDQNKNIWLVTGHFSDAANNYGAAANDISRGLKTNNKSIIEHSTEYINKATAHMDQGVSALKSLKNSVGVDSDEITVNLN